MKRSVLIVGLPTTKADEALPHALDAREVQWVPTVDEAREALARRDVDVLIARADVGRAFFGEAAQRYEDIVCVGVGEAGEDDEWPVVPAPLDAESLPSALARRRRSLAPRRVVVVDEGTTGDDLPGTHVAYEPRHTDIQALLATSAPGPIVIHAPPHGVHDALRDLRRDAASPQLHLVALTASEHPGPEAALWNAGVDDVWRPSLAPNIVERLHARCDALSRLSVEPRPPRGWRQLTATPGWRAMPGELAQTLASFLDVRLSVAAPAQMPSHWSRIPLLDVEAEVEVTAAVGASTTSLTELVQILFGEQDPSLFGDLMGELANVVMGAMKARWLEDGLVFASGLPRSGAADEPGCWCVRGAATRRFALRGRRDDGPPVSIEVAIAVRRQVRKRVPARALEEKMVLAGDVLGREGGLIALSGTRLTRQVIESIQALGLECDVVVAST